jgi:hypothetical protein
LYWYNNERPHFGINLKTPVEYLKLYYGWGIVDYLIRYLFPSKAYSKIKNNKQDLNLFQILIFCKR